MSLWKLSFDFFNKFLFISTSNSVARRISKITVFNITLCISALIIVISVMTALNLQIKSRTLAVEPHMTIELEEASKEARSSQSNPSKGMPLHLHPVYAAINSYDSFHSSLYEQQDVILRTTDGYFRGVVAKGVSPESLKWIFSEINRTRMQMDSKVELLNIDFELKSGEIIMGIDLARSLGIFEGDFLMVIPPEGLLLPPGEAPPYEKIQVKKIISTRLSEIDSQNIYYSKDNTLKRFQNNLSLRKGIEVWTNSADQVDIYKNELLKKFSDIKIETWKEKNSAMFFALKLEKFMILTFLSMATLVASFSIMSVISLLINQKKKEIGILQVMGLSRYQVRLLFLKIGFWLALLGMTSGLVIGIGISSYIQAHPLNILPNLYVDSQIPAYVDTYFVFYVIIFGLLLIWSALSYTTKSAAEIKPSSALRIDN